MYVLSQEDLTLAYMSAKFHPYHCFTGWGQRELCCLEVGHFYVSMTPGVKPARVFYFSQGHLCLDCITISSVFSTLFYTIN